MVKTSVERRQQALEAMAQAARRARGPAGTTPPVGAPVYADPEPTRLAPPPTVAARGTEHLARPSTERRLRSLIAATAVLLVAVLATLGVVDAVHQGPSSTSAIQTRQPPSSGGPAVTPGSSAPVQPPTSTTPTVSPAPSGGGPQLTSVTPTSGTAGEVVTISGAGLFSPDGQVAVTFGDQPAPTQCPTQSQCTVIVPAPGGGAPVVPVTVTTAQGASNTLTFTYQAGATAPGLSAVTPPPDGHGHRHPGHGD